MRLIDADRLKTVMEATLELLKLIFPSGDERAHLLAAFSSVRDAVDVASTIDAVPVVRCKDCKFNYANQIPGGVGCQLCVELPISDDFYCASGERKDDETD